MGVGWGGGGGGGGSTSLFFPHPGAVGIFHQVQGSLSVPHTVSFTFQRLPIVGHPFSINCVFLWVISAWTL